jgi:GntR family transcriptional regulator / MocR family aminotransferase
MNTNLSFSIQRIEKAFLRELEVPKSTKYAALYRAIKSCILNKELPGNWLIPSTRTLSEAFSLSRTTVLTAYEMLLLEKLIVAKAGSGYRVKFQEIGQLTDGENEMPNTEAYPVVSNKGRAFMENISILNRQTDNIIAFKPGLPPIDIFPINQWKNLMNLYWRYIKSSELTYGQSTGTQQLKIQISNYLNVSRAIKVDPEQIVVVSGSLQSIYLVASAVINHGDALVLEDPTFPNVHSIFKSFGAKLLPIGLDEHGLDMVEMKKIQGHKPKLVHVTPSDHYPFGVKMPLKRRLQLLEWASENRAYVIENDYEHEVANAQMSIPTIFSLDKEQRTIYLGTFNRLLYPSIRLGFMLVPKHLVPVIVALQEHSHRFVSPSLQMVMGQFIERNYLYKHLKNLIKVAETRGEIFRNALGPENRWLELLQPGFNSLHFVLRFKGDISAKKERLIIQKLLEKEIVAFSLSKCFIHSSPQTGLIVGFATTRPAIIRRKVPQLVAIVNQELD